MVASTAKVLLEALKVFNRSPDETYLVLPEIEIRKLENRTFSCVWGVSSSFV